jgi:hypothetical protein
MTPARQMTGPENIPAKTAIHASFAAMTAAGYASAKNSVTVKNQRKSKNRPTAKSEILSK